MRNQGTAWHDGVVVAAGFGLKIYVERGHLIVQDGVGRQRRTLRLNRATSGLERLVIIGVSGYITLEALRWVRDVGASFAQIGCDGEVIAVSSAERFHNTKLRRAQALASEGGLGLKVMRQLAVAKVEQQLARVEEMPHLWPGKPNGGKGQVQVAAVLARELEKLKTSETLEAVRASESVAGRWYWQTLAGLGVRFDASWRNAVPDHWRRAGARTSPPSGFKSSRKAATPFHAIVNYGYAILETEAMVALHSYGLDPGIGILHTDKRYRGSLAHDLIEPLRPSVDALVIELIGNRALTRGDAYETREGVCRLGPPLVRELAGWAPTLRAPLGARARELVELLLDAKAPQPARKRSAVIAGKGGARRLAARTLG